MRKVPVAYRQWSTKWHDWDYQTNRGDLRPDYPADPLFLQGENEVKMIKLIDSTDNKPMWVNMDLVTTMVRDEEGRSTALYFVDGSSEEVVEAPETIMAQVWSYTEH